MNLPDVITRLEIRPGHRAYLRQGGSEIWACLHMHTSMESAAACGRVAALYAGNLINFPNSSKLVPESLDGSVTVL